MSLYASLGFIRAHLRLSNPQCARLVTVRNASLNSAINRGIRKSQGVDDAPRRRPRAQEWQTRGNVRKKVNNQPDFDKDEWVRSGEFLRALPEDLERGPKKKKTNKYNHPKKRFKGGHRATEQVPERVKEHVVPPSSIPYTTPASEFIYGTNAVEAALRCSRRKLYKLYIYQAQGEGLSPAKIAIRKLALMNEVQVKMAFAEWERVLDKMSEGRPHNGCIIEVSPLPRLPVKSLRAVASSEEDTFNVELGTQSREQAAVNGMDDSLKIHHPALQHRRRYPVTLLLDGVVDTGNLGAIIRSAYYLGIDAIIFAGRNSAPLSSVTIKASAGAAENMPILEVSNEQAFIDKSKANGWRFYAADAPGPGATLVDDLSATDAHANSMNPLTQSPAVIMMGSESDGLSRHIKSHADSIVSIPGARFGTEGVVSDPARVDSLNVSVAAALLMERFLRIPLSVTEGLRGR